MDRKYYRTLVEAESHRKMGQRVHYIPSKGYYIITPKKYEDGRGWDR